MLDAFSPARAFGTLLLAVGTRVEIYQHSHQKLKNTGFNFHGV